MQEKVFEMSFEGLIDFGRKKVFEEVNLYKEKYKDCCEGVGLEDDRQVGNDNKETGKFSRDIRIGRNLLSFRD